MIAHRKNDGTADLSKKVVDAERQNQFQKGSRRMKKNHGQVLTLLSLIKKEL